MGKLLKELGKMVKKMAFLNGPHLLELHLKDSGKMICKVEKEYLSIKKALTEDSFKIFLSMALGSKNLRMETSIRVNTRMENLMAEVYMSGAMEENMKVHSSSV